MSQMTLCVLASTVGIAGAGTVLHGPSEYLSETDSPFAGLADLQLENFEDGVLNIEGVTLTGGSILGPSGLTDSVDGDDGSIDGFGRGGWSWFDVNGLAGITVTFNADILGSLPTHAGIVWTDGVGEVNFEAFNSLGESLGLVSGTHDDGGFGGGTGEDRFYGIESNERIASFRIWNSGGGIEVDHVQFVVPAGGAMGPMALLCMICGRRRR